MSIETMKFVSKSLSCYRLLYRRFVSFDEAKRPDEHPRLRFLAMIIYKQHFYQIHIRNTYEGDEFVYR